MGAVISVSWLGGIPEDGQIQFYSSLWAEGMI